MAEKGNWRPSLEMYEIVYLHLSSMLFLRLSCRRPESYSDFQGITRSFRLLGETIMVEEEEVVGAAGQRRGVSL